ncbi:hypothetical protein BKA65DRAFT_590447 [Rhexocercosporidium sp. MPI-PUGE-AT-0058]|nr:hypothetical protein BKA65DRAFT_590447 [Rhexocercosporidium sp. MPI-PUGE-AT-0058]
MANFRETPRAASARGVRNHCATAKTAERLAKLMLFIRLRFLQHLDAWLCIGFNQLLMYPLPSTNTTQHNSTSISNYVSLPDLSGSITSSVANEAFLLSPSPQLQPQPQIPKKYRSNHASRAGEPRRLPNLNQPTTSTTTRVIQHQMAPETMTSIKLLTVEFANEYIRATTTVQEGWVWAGTRLMGLFFGGVLAVIWVVGWVFL